jgi:hypothetical protein
MNYVYGIFESHKSYPDDWHTMHADDDEMFERPLYGETLAEAEKLIAKRKKAYPSQLIKEFNFKIERVPQETLTTFRNKKSSKAPKRKPVKKCKCK